jgi:hypothetical protein
MRQADARAVDPLQGALLALAVKPALDLAEQRRRLPEQFDQARLELVGQNSFDGPT